MQFLHQFDEIHWLLSLWSEPIEGNDSAKKSIEDGINYIETINREIMGINDNETLQDGMKLCSEMVRNLELPEFLVNPLVAKSFSSYLRK